ncbi:MAG: bifunctional (p)ppGpp synthetase/guanosine-3',5'-bis(diphosphate) 3'-pyrophosphohydrolase, partial [Rhodocyclaceae bacterium]|nr:bifunctional (p)ppGpp synthetase/guanosine-3',5'-bis(diphosphate) 3'-pyrophosphohydrolase [Rhodocyclaceae bacterium]
TIYVLTPAGKVLDLPRGATPVDFAYRLHTEVGHRCRGAKVDGALVPLNTQLESGKRVEIVTAKQGGPSRDWLNPQLAFITTGHAKAKVRRWFADLEAAETLAAGRSFIARELQRDGAPQANIDNLAHDLGYANQDALYMAAGRGEVGPRQIQVVLKPAEPAPQPPPMPTRPSRAQEGGGDRVLVEGVGKLLTQLGRCCKPAPPDKVAGFVTRGKGISIHRTDCANFRQMANRNPERVVDVDWGGAPAEDSVYPVDVLVQAIDRQGLLRDISEVYSREKVNVTAVNTLSKAGRARMGFTVEIRDNKHLERVLQQVREVKGVLEANRTGKPGK